jgi:hypothetical protein
VVDSVLGNTYHVKVFDPNDDGEVADSLVEEVTMPLVGVSNPLIIVTFLTLTKQTKWHTLYNNSKNQLIV